MKKEILEKLNKVISEEKVDEETYYKEIDDLIGEEIEYYGSKVKVEQVFKYVKWEHFFDGYTITDEQTDVFNELAKKNAPGMKKLEYGEIRFPGQKAIYIVNVLDKSEDDENKYMYADTSAFKHSEKLRLNK